MKKGLRIRNNRCKPELSWENTTRDPVILLPGMYREEAGVQHSHYVCFGMNFGITI